MNILCELNSLIKFLKYSTTLKYFKNLTNLVLPFGCTAFRAGWPKWTRTTDLVLIRHAL